MQSLNKVSKMSVQSESENFELIIEPGRIEKQYFHDLWRYRELFYFLSMREILVRYKQTVLGVIWALLRPMLTIIIFTVVFGKLAKLPTNGVPYPLLVLAGLLPWQLFSNALLESSNSLVSNSNLISKVYFPRLIIPTSFTIVSFVDFLISFGLFVILMIIYGFNPGIKIFLLPLFIMIAFVAALGAGLWFSALNVKYRDIRYIVPFIVQLGLYISPVGFLSSIVPEKWQMLYSINPMVGVIDGFRYALLGNLISINWISFGISLVLVGILFITGLSHFRKTEKTFADDI